MPSSPGTLKYTAMMAVSLFTAGEMLSVAEHFLEQQMHPTVVISAYRMALEDMINTLKKIRYGARLEMDSVGSLG